jgi:ABC-2 type transport system permease protein
MTAVRIGLASLRRVLRDPTAAFFMLILPVLIIVVVGATAASGRDHFDVGVLDRSGGDRLAARLVEALDASDALDVTSFDDRGSLERAVRRGEVAAGVVVPAGTDDAHRAGRTVEVGVLVEPTNSSALAARSAIAAVVDAEDARLGAAAFVEAETGADAGTAAEAVDAATAAVEPVTVQRRAAGGESRFLPDGFSYSAPTMLVLFVFINAIAGGASMIQTRQLGVYDRMLAAPVGSATIVLGELLSFALIALVQSLLIVAVGAAVFGVSWGDPVAAAALVVAWVLVGTGAGVLSGTLFRTPDQATAIGPTVGIALGMLGGCIWPLEIVPGPMQTVGHLVPHAWAVDAWTELLSRSGGLGDIAGRLGVLLAFAAGLTAVATFRLRRSLRG